MAFVSKKSSKKNHPNIIFTIVFKSDKSFLVLLRRNVVNCQIFYFHFSSKQSKSIKQRYENFDLVLNPNDIGNSCGQYLPNWPKCGMLHVVSLFMELSSLFSLTIWLSSLLGWFNSSLVGRLKGPSSKSK